MKARTAPEAEENGMTDKSHIIIISFKQSTSIKEKFFFQYTAFTKSVQLCEFNTDQNYCNYDFHTMMEI